MSYMIQTIMPSMMMVVCSYGSLFIPHDQVPYQLYKMCSAGVFSDSSLTLQITLLQVPGRMMLSITTTLTLVTLSNGLFNTSPRTSYLKGSFFHVKFPTHIDPNSV